MFNDDVVFRTCQPYQPTCTPVNTITTYNLFSPLVSTLITSHNAHEHEFLLGPPATEHLLTYNVGGSPVHSINNATIACCGMTVQTDKEGYLAPDGLNQKRRDKEASYLRQSLHFHTGRLSGHVNGDTLRARKKQFAERLYYSPESHAFTFAHFL